MEKNRAIWFEEEVKSLEGCDFSHLTGRWKSDPLPWDYGAIIKHYHHSSNKLLDLGTGGGEFLLTLAHLDDCTFVTEGYPPNYDRCMQILAP